MIADHYCGAVVGRFPVRAEPFAVIDFWPARRRRQATKERHEGVHAHTCSVNYKPLASWPNVININSNTQDQIQDKSYEQN